MALEPVMTEDGSLTFYVPDLKEHYHSTFGAVQESRHVFIQAGLGSFASQKEVSILEIGFGTGLNAFLSLAETKKNGQRLFYAAVELFPLDESHYSKLNYPEVTGFTEYKELYHKLHSSPWNVPVQITELFCLEKLQADICNWKSDPEKFNLIFFDAFGPDVQPELWKEAIFTELYKTLKPGGILVTYSAKGSVRRAMKSAGFGIEKLPGPKGKREMTRAMK
ncbi:MAG: tRNA (5-methylaminomethyl-2-thiouridine)(34)-methyltransferase MnmD [Bacteroidetes bacterium]|nr:tRNA (5-methylaminomethyl-2-thiouridine)(34)-methyltransferase MnmD [Bacteroidota bacterium]